MPKPTGCCRLFLLLLPALVLLVTGVVTIILERISSATIREQSRNGGRWNSGVYGGGADFNQAPSIAILGTCILVYIVSAIDVFGIWELRRVEGTAGHQRAWAWIVFTSNLVMVGASAGVLAYASSMQSSEKKPQRPEDLTDSDASFTRETWACAMADFYPKRAWPGAACGLARATRLFLIPVAVAALLVLVSLWVLVRSRGGVRWFFGGKGRYAGFANVYELRPTSPGAQRVVQPQQTWVAYPVQQWPMQQGQQVYQQVPPQQTYQLVPQQPGAPGPEGAPKTEQRAVFR